MRGGVRAGALRDVDRKDEELSVGLEEDFVGSCRAEGRESGRDCTGMVSRTQKILIQHQTVRQGNSGTIQISCYTNSQGKDITFF